MESSAITVQPRNSSLALVPQSFEQAMQFANVLAKASIVPPHLRGKPEDCFLILMRASEWGMNPLAVAEKTSIISGKLMYEGQLVAALINTRCDLEEPLNYIFSGEGKARSVKVVGKRSTWKESRDILLTFEQALKINKNGQMGINPDQQMCYIGARIWARRHSPEALLGVYATDEIPEVADAPLATTEAPQGGDNGGGQPAGSEQPKPRAAIPGKYRKGAAAAAEPVKAEPKNVTPEPAATPAAVETTTSAPANPPEIVVESETPASEPAVVEPAANAEKPATPAAASAYKPKYPQPDGYPKTVEVTFLETKDRSMEIDPRDGSARKTAPTKLVVLGGKDAALLQSPKAVIDADNTELVAKAKVSDAVMKLTVEIWPSLANPANNLQVITAGEDVETI